MAKTISVSLAVFWGIYGQQIMEANIGSYKGSNIEGGNRDKDCRNYASDSLNLVSKDTKIMKELVGTWRIINR